MTTHIAKTILLPAAVLLASVAPMTGQTLKAFDRAASKSAEQRDYYSAMKYLEAALTIDSSRTDLLVRHGDYSRLFGAPGSAVESYTKALRADPTGQHAAAYRGLAEAEKSLGNYNDAVKHFQLFLDKNPGASFQEKEAVNQAILDCDWAVSMLGSPAPDVLLERLTDDVNTPMADFAPVKKGDTLFYSSFREMDWKDKHFPPRPIVKVMQAVGEAEPVETQFNDPARHTAHSAFSPKGDLMVYTLCDYTGTVDIKCQLFFRKKEGGGWSAPERLPAFINADSATTTQPSIAFGYEKGKLTLFFTSDKKGGRGGMDIYASTMEADGSWGLPENLAAINTAGNDITPFFDTEIHTLYFSTDGRRSLGGYDIYKSEQNLLVGGPSADDPMYNWALPENLGLPFNSAGNDLYFMEQKDGEATFFASNRAGSSQIDKDACCYDIYRTKLLPLKLETLVFSKTGQAPIPGVNVRMVEVEGPADAQQNTGDDNQADFQVNRNKRYMLVAEKEGYLPDTTYLTTNEVPVNRIFRSTLFLDLKKKEEPDWNKPEPKLTPGWLNQFLPVTLYFDNDEPNRNTWATTTTLTYDQTYVKYISRKDEFVRVFSRGMSGEKRIAAETELGDFFEKEVKFGYDRLEVFAKNLQRFLDNGYGVEIIIKGYASPLAKPTYNQNLTLRRSNCVLNFLNKAEGGIYQKYIADGRLVLTTVGFGEEKAKPGVNDNARETRLSIFSPDASRERRAEIIEVKLLKQ